MGELGDEGYTIATDARAVTIRANTPAGLFHGVQTLRQLLPASTAADGGHGPCRAARSSTTRASPTAA